MKTHRHDPSRSNLYSERMTFCGITGYSTRGERTAEGWKVIRRQSNPIQWVEGLPSCRNCQARLADKFGPHWPYLANKMEK